MSRSHRGAPSFPFPTSAILHSPARFSRQDGIVADHSPAHRLILVDSKLSILPHLHDFSGGGGGKGGRRWKIEESASTVAFHSVRPSLAIQTTRRSVSYAAFAEDDPGRGARDCCLRFLLAPTLALRFDLLSLPRAVSRGTLESCTTTRGDLQHTLSLDPRSKFPLCPFPCSFSPSLLPLSSSTSQNSALV